jgi:hypothetical protein
MYVDILYGREKPEPGWYLQAIGRHGTRNSAYLVLTAREAKRRDPQDSPRIYMDVELLVDSEIPKGAHVFEFYWYPRKKRKRTFEQDIRRSHAKNL